MLTNQNWYQDKLTAVLAIIISGITLISSYFHYGDATSYRALPQQVLLDVFNRPIGDQDLLVETTHNPQYRENTGLAETSSDFTKEALLDLFTYDFEDLESGRQLKKFTVWLENDVGERLYSDVFVNLSQQRIVMAQEGYVRAKMIGELEYIGSAEREYVSRAGLGLLAMTHKFTGKMIVTAYADDEYPTVYNNVTIIVQRTLLQDKIKGYQIVQLELN